MTIEALETLGASFNFIEIWIKMLEENYDARRVSYSTSVKELFKQISTTMTKPLSPRQKSQKLLTEIVNGTYKE